MDPITVEKMERFISERKDDELIRIRHTQENVDPGFNAFNLISDTFYRENFHSDIIKAILDVDGKHQAGNEYLLLFISLLNQFLKKDSKTPIDSNHYKNKVSVTREVGRRDITIIGENNHAIIIENKINDAGDTNNQIPSYVEKLESENRIVDVVVYLTLNQAKEPNEATWKVTREKKNEIKNKLISLRAFNGKENDLCSGWLKKCIDITAHIDSLSILRQYHKILKYLTRNHMDHEYMKTFYNYLEKKQENSEILLSIRNASNELPWYICTEIYNHFQVKNDVQPFDHIGVWKDVCYYLGEYKIGNCSFVMDIAVSNLDYCFIDFSSRIPAWKKEPAEVVLKEVGVIDEFKWNDKGRLVHVFHCGFMQYKEKVIEFISLFLSLLKEKEKSIEAALLKSDAEKITVL